MVWQKWRQVAAERQNANEHRMVGTRWYGRIRTSACPASGAKGVQVGNASKTHKVKAVCSTVRHTRTYIPQSAGGASRAWCGRWVVTGAAGGWWCNGERRRTDRTPAGKWRRSTCGRAATINTINGCWEPEETGRRGVAGGGVRRQNKVGVKW